MQYLLIALAFVAMVAAPAIIASMPRTAKDDDL